MMRNSSTAAGLILAVALASHQRAWAAVESDFVDSTVRTVLPRDLTAELFTSSNGQRDGKAATLSSTEVTSGDEKIQRLPTVSAIRHKKTGEIARLFPQGSELPPAQTLPSPVPSPLRTAKSQVPGAEDCAIPRQLNRTAKQQLRRAKDLTEMPSEPTAIKRLPQSSRSDEPALAEAPRVPATADTRPPLSPSDPLDDILRNNVLVNPLSGTFDFTESMSANIDTEASLRDVDPQQLGRISLPASLATRVDTIIADATKLADRGALFAAQREFLRALRMTTRALDTSLGRSYHAQALANGLRALEEADDFALQPADSVESDLRLANYIKGHRTPVLKQDAPESLTPLMALQRYYEYAREQLTLAGGGSPLAAKAIYSIGRVEMLQQSETSATSQGAPKSLALFHAALTIDPRNASAANELGVMLAGRGRLREAAALFERSVSAVPTPAALENLATVYEQLGDPRAARWRQGAQQIALQTYGTPQVTPQPIVWLTPQAFGNADPDGGSPPWPADAASFDRSHTQQAQRRGRDRQPHSGSN